MKGAKWVVRVQACTAIILMFILVFSITPSVAENNGQNPNNTEYAQGTSNLDGENATAAKWKAMGKTVLIPPGAFTTDGYSTTTYFKDFMGGYFWATSDITVGATCLVAPVRFPQGAKKLTHAYAYAQDGNASHANWFALDRIDYRAGTVVRLGWVSTTDATSITEYEIPISDIKISEDYLYQLTTCGYTGIKVYGAKVLYK